MWPNNAGLFGASIGNALYKREKKHGTICTILPFQGNLPINYALLGGNGNTPKKGK
jgi:hypothetical protein